MERKENDQSSGNTDILKPIKDPSYKHSLIRFFQLLVLILAVLSFVIFIVFTAMRGVNDQAFLYTATLYLAITMISLIILLTFTNIFHRVFREREDRKKRKTVEEISKRIRTLSNEKATHKEFNFLEKYFNQFKTIEDTEDYLSHDERILLKEMLRKNDVVPHLEKTARQSSRKWHRVHAILMLGWVGAEEKQEFLARALLDPDKDIGYAAAHALSELNTKKSYESLLKGLELSHLSKSRIATFLENSRYPDKLSILKEKINIEDPKVKTWVVYLIGKLKDINSLTLLETLSKDKDQSIRANVAFSLGELRNKKATPLIKKLLRDTDWIVRVKAAKAAEKLNDIDLLGELFLLLRDKHWWVREDASRAIAKQGKEAVPLLKRHLKERDHFARNMSAEILTRIGEVKNQIKNLSSSAKRNEAKIFLSRVGTADAADYLAFESRNEKPETQLDIIEILESTPGPESLEGLKDFKDSPNPVVAKRAMEALRNKKRRHHE